MTGRSTSMPVAPRRRRSRSRMLFTFVIGALGAVGITAASVQRNVEVNTPRAIAGGRFEASGVAYVPGTNQLLFVDDGRPRDLFLMELAPDGQQKGRASRVPFGANVTDLEALTSDDEFFYAVGSQSKTSGFEGDGLVRFTFDPATRRVARLERIQGLKAWLAANVPELHGTERRLGDHVLNIEGLAWDPRGKRLLLGLRAPVVNGEALVIPIRLADPASAFTRENLRTDGPTIRVRLGGAGIRSIEYDGASGAFWVISGADLNAENRDFHVAEWNGDSTSALRHFATYSRGLKPEGITRAMIDGRPVRVLVFDTGRYTVMPDENR